MTSKTDLGVKIGSKAQVLWENVLRNAKIVKEQAEETLIVQEAIITLAEEKVKKETETFK